MARSLAFGPYTHQDVMARLASPAAGIGSRYELLDNTNAVVGELDGITAAKITVDIDRKINSALALSSLPDAKLEGQMLHRRVRPWFRLRMGDGGIAEWPMGIYVYIEPDRTVEGVGLDEWDIVLPDLSYVLESSGPDLPGYTATQGSFVLSHVEAILRKMGFNDFSGITPTGAKLPAESFWGLVRVTGIAGPGEFEGVPIFEQGKTSPQTWLDVQSVLHKGAGSYPPWFDLTGRYRLQKVPNLAAAEASIEYRTTREQLATGFDTSADPSVLANRVVARANNSGGFFGFEAADADLFLPQHPLAERNLGYPMSVTIDVPTAESGIELFLAALSELFMRLSRHETVALRTMPNPAHERYDVLSVQWEGDSVLDQPRRFQERGWTLDLFSGEMTHTLYRLLQGDEVTPAPLPEGAPPVVGPTLFPVAPTGTDDTANINDAIADAAAVCGAVVLAGAYFISGDIIYDTCVEMYGDGRTTTTITNLTTRDPNDTRMLTPNGSGVTGFHMHDIGFDQRVDYFDPLFGLTTDQYLMDVSHTVTVNVHDCGFENVRSYAIVGVGDAAPVTAPSFARNVVADATGNGFAFFGAITDLLADQNTIENTQEDGVLVADTENYRSVNATISANHIHNADTPNALNSTPSAIRIIGADETTVSFNDLQDSYGPMIRYEQSDWRRCTNVTMNNNDIDGAGGNTDGSTPTESVLISGVDHLRANANAITGNQSGADPSLIEYSSDIVGI